MKKDFSEIEQSLTMLAKDYLRQQKKQRSWQRLRRILILGLIIGIGTALWFNSHISIEPHVGLIDIKGPISDGQIASSDLFMKELTQAYRNHSALKALILRIESPGGSPVQADYMFNAI